MEVTVNPVGVETCRSLRQEDFEVGSQEGATS